MSNVRIEIGGGLGDFKGKAWRIGLMGYASTQSNVMLVLTALGSILEGMGQKISAKEGINAALAIYAK